MKNAFVADGIVHEFIEPRDGHSLEELYHPDYLASVVRCPNKVQIGWTYDGETFAPPKPPEASEE